MGKVGLLCCYAPLWWDFFMRFTVEWVRVVHIRCVCHVLCGAGNCIALAAVRIAVIFRSAVADLVESILHSSRIWPARLDSHSWVPENHWNTYFVCDRSKMYFYRIEEHTLRLWMLKVMLKVDEVRCVSIRSQFYKKEYYFIHFSSKNILHRYFVWKSCELISFILCYSAFK